MSQYPAKYRVIYGGLIVTKPTGEISTRETIIYWDSTNNTIGIHLIGDSAIKGYSFDVRMGEVNRAVQEGEWMNELPQG